MMRVAHAVVFLSLLAAAALAATPRRDIVGTEKPRYSHANEELVIRDYFQDQRGGFFLDVGCGHPIEASNSYFLEKHLGWSGIGIDALPEMAFDHGAIALAGRERLRAKLSYTNVGFALAPSEFAISELRDLYAAALGHAVSTTNLQRVLLRRGLLEETGDRRPPGKAGGRPATVFRFRSRELEVTDPFAVLRPPAGA